MAATTTAKPLRADAKRNRDALLQAAHEVFSVEGVLASLDGIALRAGVGNATLYRNFPTRDDLLAAVIEDSIKAMLVEADELAATRDPAAALATWVRRLTWEIRIWHDLPGCVVDVLAEAASPLKSACEPLQERTGAFLERARHVGAIADGVTADEVFQLVTAISWASDRFGDDQPAAARRTAIATAGLFTRPDAATCTTP